jgi:secreted trypsin-like serine protease
LVCEIDGNPGHYHQAGIVVGGIGCGNKNVPGFYVDVAKYREWIDDQIDALSFDVRSYTV